MHQLLILLWTCKTRAPWRHSLVANDRLLLTMKGTTASRKARLPSPCAGGTPAARERLPEASCTSVASGSTSQPVAQGVRRSLDCIARHESSKDVPRHKLCQVSQPQVARMLPAHGLGRVSITRTAQHIRAITHGNLPKKGLPV